MKLIIAEAKPPRKDERVFGAYMRWVPKHGPNFDEPPDPQTCGDGEKNDPDMPILACPCHLTSSACDTCIAPHRIAGSVNDDD